tara:strand:- start:857 stop:1060 length:204 start_codon:yes stop_codon:yes gene_type:complete
MTTNIKVLIIIIFGIIALYFSKAKYGDYSKSKSIKACMIAQQQKSKNMTTKEIIKYCEEEVNKNFNK